MKPFRILCAVLMLATLSLRLFSVPANAEDKTCTVTANLYVPGDLNTQLPGVTAYVTNGNNPLGLGGYEAVAPTTPVSDNAELTVCADGTLRLSVPVPNPVFTVQEIGGCSNAVVLDAPRDDETYGTQDGSASRDGRITSLTLELLDQSGTYVFTSCTEFPTLLGVDWTVPLTLSVDFTGVDFAVTPEKPESAVPASGTPAPEINFDRLNAVIQTAEQTVSSAVVSEDGSDVESSKTWTVQTELDALSTELAKAKAALSAADQDTADKAAEALTAACAAYQAAQKSGTKQAESEALGKVLASGAYTVSANIWFNKADTGLPLNPHLTNSTFPPYNPVPDNAELTIDGDGGAQLVIPIVIPGKVMTLRELRGVTILGAEKTEDGAMTSIQLDLGQLSGDHTVVSAVWEADIEMGDLAMSISGLEKSHTWPAQFELNLSGVATTDGGVMPTVELNMMDAAAATDAMAAVQGGEETEEPAPPEENPEAGSPKQEERSETSSSEPGKRSKTGSSEAEHPDTGQNAGIVAVVVLIVIATAAAAVVVTVKKRKDGRQA